MSRFDHKSIASFIEYKMDVSVIPWWSSVVLGTGRRWAEYIWKKIFWQYLSRIALCTSFFPVLLGSSDICMMYLPFSLTVLSTVTKTSSALNIFGMTRQEISRFWGGGGMASCLLHISVLRRNISCVKWLEESSSVTRYARCVNYWNRVKGKSRKGARQSSSAHFTYTVIRFVCFHYMLATTHVFSWLRVLRF